MNLEKTGPTHQKVLVVEDHEETRRLILATLKLRDFDTETAIDAVSGFVKFNSFKPDLVLLDIMMPGVGDGLDLCRQIREKVGDAVKIAFVTAKGENSDLVEGRRANADACITKPFSPIKFLENVDWLLV